MKYLISIGIITAVCFAGELLYFLLPLPVPAGIYGLLILLALLLTGIVKERQMEQTAHFFLTVMPLLFLEPAVKLMTSFQALRGNIIPILLLCLVSTVVVTAVTGVTAEKICSRQNTKEKDVKRQTLKSRRKIFGHFKKTQNRHDKGERS